MSLIQTYKVSPFLPTDLYTDTTCKSTTEYLQVHFFAPFERNILNPAGYCVIGAPFRTAFGILQIIGSVAAAAIGYLLSLFFNYEPNYLALAGTIDHGFVNIGRSLIEYLGLGKAVLGLRDDCANDNRKQKNPDFKYPNRCTYYREAMILRAKAQHKQLLEQNQNSTMWTQHSDSI